MVFLSGDPELTMHEWDMTAVQERIKELEEALLWVALNDWSWVGDGSDNRRLHSSAMTARKCLGLPTEIKPGCPNKNGEEVNLRKLLTERHLTPKTGSQ